MTRIGYSLRLAFPSRADRRRLVELIQAANWRDRPTVLEALQLIGQTIGRFSSDFREVFALARRGFAQAAATPELQSLWSAVQEAALVAIALPGPETPRVRYQLFLQENDLPPADLFLLATQASAPRNGVHLTPLEYPRGDYAFLVNTGTADSTTHVAKQLLLGLLPDLLSRPSAAPLARAIRQGVLLFQSEDLHTWELSLSRPEEGAARALLHERLREPFLGLFAAQPPRTRRSKFEGWVEIDSFDVASLGAVAPGEASALADVRCLQATRIGPHIDLIGGVQVDNGYLGLRGLLPTLRCHGAQELRLFVFAQSSLGRTASSRTSLPAVPGDPGAFEFPAEMGDLEGDFRLVALTDGKAVASRAVTFYARVLTHDYKAPQERNDWLLEAAGPAVLDAVDGRDYVLASAPEHAERCLPVSLAAFGIGANRTVGGSVESFSIDDDPRLDRFVEALAALAARRKGLAEAEVLTLLAKQVGVDDYSLGWDVLRAWVEAGYLDTLIRRRWRGRVYFARAPRLVVTCLDPRPIVVLHGLAPSQLRAHARSVFGDLGSSPVPTFSMSPLVGAPPSWEVESLDAAASAAVALALDPPAFVRSPSQILAPMTAITEVTVGPLPGYEYRGDWDGNEGGFRRHQLDHATTSVRVEWHTRPDRPDLFVVTRGDGEGWSTHARNWAILIGYLWAGKQPFEERDEATLVRVGGFGPYMPLPVARALALRSGMTSGPVGFLSRDRGYAYSCGTASERRSLLRRLQGDESNESDPQSRWLLAALADGSATSDTVPLPPNLRRGLGALEDRRMAAWLRVHRVPRRMMPYVRRAAARGRGR